MARNLNRHLEISILNLHKHSISFHRYSSSHNILNDELSHTSSTLRQEVISVTKVRCKQRQTWFNSSNNQGENKHTRGIHIFKCIYIHSLFA